MSSEGLSRRERQIMDILYQKGRATVAEVQELLQPSVSYSGTRALLRILEGKGHIRHIEDGPRYLFEPSQPASAVANTALDQVLNVFFGGSVERAVASLLSGKERKLKRSDIERLENMIKEAKEASHD